MKPTIYIVQVLVSLGIILGILGWTAFVAKACMVSPREVKTLMNQKQNNVSIQDLETIGL